jgi:hypothetical protein
MKCVFLLLTAAVAFCVQGAVTLDEKFPDGGLVIGENGKSWNARELVGDNQGSIFFDAVFSEAANRSPAQRVLMHLRTAGRLTLAWNAYFNETLQCELTDQSKTYRVTFKELKIEYGRKYSLGVTWNGEVVRVYIDGVAVDSGVQPIAIKKAKVAKLNIGPYTDKYRVPHRWKSDIVISRLRVWDEAVTPAAVAAEHGIELKALTESNKAFLTVPRLPKGVAAPKIDGRLDEEMWKNTGSLVQLIHGNFVGKSGRLPPHSFRLAYDDEKLYLGFDTLFPGGFSCVEGIARTPESEPEAWGAESWEFFFRMNGKLYRFAGNYAGGTLESCYPGGKKWNGKWEWAFSKTKNIDDSVLWQGETEIPWKTLGLDGPYTGESNFNFARSWTIPTCGTISSLNEAGRGYIPDKDCPMMAFAPTAGYLLRRRTDPAQGEYEEEYSLCAGAKGGRIVYEVSLAARDGSLGFKRIHRTEVTAKAGEVFPGSFKAFTAVPGYDAIVHVLTFNGKTVMRQAVPYDLDTRVFEVKPLYLKEKVRVHFRRPFEGIFEVIAPDGKCIRSQHTDGSDFEFPFLRGSAPGEYRFSIKRADGAQAGSVISFYPGIGEWEKQDAHKDWVLPPYSPLKAEFSDNSLSAEVSMRRYEWNKSLLPSGLTSQGEEMLAGPIELVVGGEVVPCSQLLLTTNSPVRVGFAASGSSTAAKVRNDAWLEYDGVQYNTFSVVPLKAGCDIKLRYRLKRGIDKYLHASAGGQWGSKRTLAIADGASSLGAYPILWTGNEEKGLCFFYESRESWNAKPEKTYAFEKNEDGLQVTVSIGRKLPVGKEISFSIGFVGSPARPLAPNYPYDTFSISTSANLNRPGRRPTLDVALMDCPIRRGDLGSYFADLDEPDYRTDLKRYRWVVEHHGRESGARLVPYTCARFLSSAYPEVRAFLPEWTFTPEFALDYSHTGKFLYECCPASSATDFFVWKFKTLMKLVPEIKGIYLDFGLVHECSNKEHGCFKSMAILGQREFYRRLAVAQIEAGITNPVIVIHNTDCVQLPAMTFVTHLLNGENIRQESSTMLHNKKDILDTLGIERFASELSTLPWGISNSFYMPYDTLTKKNGGDEPTHLYSFRMGLASIGAGLVHNTMQAMHRNHVGLFDKVIRIFDAFGVGDKNTRFVGYWRKPATVKNGKGVYVSCYTDGKKLLAVISHLAKAHLNQDVEISFNLKDLGIKGKLNRAVDMMPAEDPDYQYLFDRKAEKGKDIAKSPIGLGEFGTKVLGFDGETLKLHLPYHRFAIVQIEP